MKTTSLAKKKTLNPDLNAMTLSPDLGTRALLSKKNVSGGLHPQTQ